MIVGMRKKNLGFSWAGTSYLYERLILTLWLCVSAACFADNSNFQGERMIDNRLTNHVNAVRYFDIGAQDIPAALLQLGEQAELTVMVHPEAIGDTPGLQGEYTTDEALAQLLSGSGLDYQTRGDAIIVTRMVAELTPGPRTTKAPLFKRFGTAIATALFATSSGVAIAADESNEVAFGGIEEVVVTARRREESVQEVPIPISALSADQLLSRGITEIQHIEQLTPNMSFNETVVARGTATVYLRGIGTINWSPNQDPKVGIYIDGVYLGRPQGAVFDLFDVERVEVLRGPQGTLYGRNTTAGLVHVITKKPESEFDATLRAGVGNAGRFTADGMINMPLIDDVLAARVAFQTRKDDGWMKDDAGREWNTTDSSSLRGTLLWTPNDDLEVSLAAEFFRARETGGLGDCEGNPGGPVGLNFLPLIFGAYDELEAACAQDDNPYRSNDNDPNDLKIDTNAVTLTVAWDMLPDVTLTSISAWRDTRELNESWGWGSDFNGGPSFHIEILSDEYSDYDQLSQEFRLEGTAFSDRMSWTTGVYGFKEQGIFRVGIPLMRGLMPPDDLSEAPLFEALGAIALGAQQFGSIRQEVDGRNKSWAVFAEATMDVTDAWSVTAGWRWTKDMREFKRSQWLYDGSFDAGYACPGNIGADGLAIRSHCIQKVSYTKSTPRVIVNYVFNDDVMSYLSYSRGYSAGGLNGDVFMQPYKPEISDNWEVGMKSELFDRRMRLNVSVFHNDYQNHQITVGRVIDGQIQENLFNAQESTLEGIEVELFATPSEGWLVTGTYGYLRGKYDKFLVTDTSADPLTFEDVTVDRDLSDISFLQHTPGRSWNVSVAKEFTLNNGGMLTTRVGYNYRGRYYSSAALTRLDRHRTDTLGMVDARVRWDMPNGKTSVSLWGTNLSDEVYWRYAQDLEAAGILTYYNAEPRRFGLTLEHHFR